MCNMHYKPAAEQGLGCLSIKVEGGVYRRVNCRRLHIKNLPLHKSTHSAPSSMLKPSRAVSMKSTARRRLQSASSNCRNVLCVAYKVMLQISARESVRETIACNSRLHLCDTRHAMHAYKCTLKNDIRHVNE